MFDTRGNDINARRVDAAVTENVGELGNILFNTVEHPREQMPQVVREYLTRIDIGVRAEFFHLSPDHRTADRISVLCRK